MMQQRCEKIKRIQKLSWILKPKPHKKVKASNGRSSYKNRQYEEPLKTPFPLPCIIEMKNKHSKYARTINKKQKRGCVKNIK
jgi:hypothetical protein